MKVSRKILIAMLAILLIATSVMMCACDNTPSEYKPRKFYGTYTHFANNYYHVVCGVYDEELGGQRAVIFDDIVSINGSTYAYISKSTGEIEEKEADPLLLAKVQELMNKIGTSITVKKNKIICNDSGVIINYDKTVYKQVSNDEFALVFYDAGRDVCMGKYDDNRRTVIVGLYDDNLLLNESKYDIVVSKTFKY